MKTVLLVESNEFAGGELASFFNNLKKIEGLKSGDKSELVIPTNSQFRSNDIYFQVFNMKLKDLNASDIFQIRIKI